LDEIADVHAAREGGPGAKARERADVAVGPDARAVDHAVGKDLRVGADLAVADHAAGADSYPVPERHLSLEHDVHVDEHIAPMGHAAAHVDPRGVRERNAREHELAGDARSEEHTSELQSPCNLVCRLLLEKKKKK